MPGGSPEEAALWASRGYSVVRLDIESRTNPDLLGTMTAIPSDGPFDAIFCNNALEHLYPQEVLPALREFYRVLRPGGIATIIVPDLQDVRPTEDVIPEIGMPGLHLYYGDPERIIDYPYMAHHCGFVEVTLRDVLLKAGFVPYMKRLPCHQLLGAGVK